MTWLFVLTIALAAFALAVWAFALPRELWTTLLAALIFGLAGYAFQARSDLPGAPRSAASLAPADAWASVEARKEMVAGRYRSDSPKLLIADALARQGQFANAAGMLRGAINDDPRDGEAWLALANALVEHAQGALTPPALFAYQRAAATAPGSPAPGYFLGVALIREGQILEAREVWSDALTNATPDLSPASNEPADPRLLLARRLARLDALLNEAGAASSADDAAPEIPAAAPVPAAPAS